MAIKIDISQALLNSQNNLMDRTRGFIWDIKKDEETLSAAIVDLYGYSGQMQGLCQTPGLVNQETSEVFNKQRLKFDNRIQCGLNVVRFLAEGSEDVDPRMYKLFEKLSHLERTHEKIARYLDKLEDLNTDKPNQNTTNAIQKATVVLGQMRQDLLRHTPEVLLCTSDNTQLKEQYCTQLNAPNPKEIWEAGQNQVAVTYLQARLHIPENGASKPFDAELFEFLVNHGHEKISETFQPEFQPRRHLITLDDLIAPTQGNRHHFICSLSTSPLFGFLCDSAPLFEHLRHCQQIQMQGQNNLGTLGLLVKCGDSYFPLSIEENGELSLLNQYGDEAHGDRPYLITFANVEQMLNAFPPLLKGMCRSQTIGQGQQAEDLMLTLTPFCHKDKLGQNKPPVVGSLDLSSSVISLSELGSNNPFGEIRFKCDTGGVGIYARTSIHGWEASQAILLNFDEATGEWIFPLPTGEDFEFKFILDNDGEHWEERDSNRKVSEWEITPPHFKG